LRRVTSPLQAGSSLKTPAWVFYLRSALSTAVPLAKMWPADKIILLDYQIGNFLLYLSLLLKDK
jgi:hypothetical protein